MRVVLGTLAKSALETRVGPDIPAGINSALVFYVGKLSNGRGPAKFPKFLLPNDEGGSEGPESTAEAAASSDRPEVEVEVDERIEAAIFSDSRRQGVSPGDLAGHAVLVYLAELDRVGAPDLGASAHSAVGR